MDKLQQLYDLYLSNGLISEAIDLNTFSESTPEQIQKLYDLGKSNGLFEKTDVNVFSSAWDEKKNPNLIYKNIIIKWITKMHLIQTQKMMIPLKH